MQYRVCNPCTRTTLDYPMLLITSWGNCLATEFLFSRESRELKTLKFLRRHPDLNRGMEVLQTSALPLGYVAAISLTITYYSILSGKLHPTSEEILLYLRKFRVNEILISEVMPILHEDL
jgi:hypothetical protein